MENYSKLDKLLHKAVLGLPILGESLFDIEKALFLSKVDPAVGKKSVYVLGLARAGTTTLMRELYGSGDFASLTYQDMPFVMAPNLWGMIAGANKKRTVTAERAHGDGIFVDSDSPEALEEVFWKTFHASEYISEKELISHSPLRSSLDEFDRYQRLVCLRYGRSRYLSKNNNNILRIESLAGRFPDDCFFVMFRDPVTQAQSLMKQHQQFSGSPDFVRDYMAWLAHFEFGDNHRPFAFCNGFVPHGGSDSVEYWLSIWHEVYRHLLGIVKKRAYDNVRLVCYEALCAQPEYWGRICEAAEISISSPVFRLAAQSEVDGIDEALLKSVYSVYDEMVSLDSFTTRD